MDDLLIKNGFMIDPARRIQKAADLVISGGKIKAIRDSDEWVGELGNQGRPENQSRPENQAKQIVNAAGCIITPGWIDHHTHLYPLIRNGIPAEAICFASGVTTAVDAGSTGCQTYGEKRCVMKNWRLGMKAYLNVSSQGLASLPEPEQTDPKFWDEAGISRMFAEYGTELLGLKLRTSRSIVGSQGYRPLYKTVELADKLGVPVMIHCTDPPGTMEELLSVLRPGDILTHMYQNIGETILDRDGHVKEAAWKARERGVLFEAADARAHFSFEVSEPALKERFAPDLIATDLTAFSMYQRPTAFNMAMQVSKYGAMGMDLYEVIRRCTELPAKSMGLLGEIGTLEPGRYADVTVIRPEYRYVEFGDRPDGEEGQRIRKGTQIYRPMLTLKKGEIMYRDAAF